MLRLRCCVLTHLLSSPATYPAKYPLSSLHRFLSATTPTPAVSPIPSFAVEEYLVYTCGLTRAQALKASTKLTHLKSPSNPDAGLGLSSSDVASVVAKDPRFLCAKVDKTLSPIVVGLNSLGISHTEIARLVSLTPTSFRCRSIVSNLPYYMSLFGSYENLLLVLRHNNSLLTRSLEKVVKPNVAFMLERGLGACHITKLCMSYPWLLTAGLTHVQATVACDEGLGVPHGSGIFKNGLHTTDTERVQAILACAKGLGVPYGSVMFREALQAVSFLGEEKVAAKMEYLKNTFRWSEAQVGIAVSKFPRILRSSKNTLQSRSEFLISEVGLEPSYIAHRPALLSYSLEGRLRPRYYVVKFLKENGLLDHDRDYYSAAVPAEKVFLEKYISPHNEAAPYLAEDYATACKGEVPARFRST